jgi:hypothetical protein
VNKSLGLERIEIVDYRRDLDLDQTRDVQRYRPQRILFEKLRLTITHEPFLEVEGKLQHLEGVVSVLAQDVRGLNAPALIESQSCDFH